MKKGNVADKTPVIENLEPGKTYAWCACGKSKNQPWCDGSHQGSEFSPKMFSVNENTEAVICMCKQTNNPPYCDGSHMELKD